MPTKYQSQPARSSTNGVTFGMTHAASATERTTASAANGQTVVQSGCAAKVTALTTSPGRTITERQRGASRSESAVAGLTTTAIPSTQIENMPQSSAGDI